MIEFVVEDRDYKNIVNDESKIIKWIEGSINNENFIADNITFIHCSDEFLLSINQKYLQHDYYTDVITFDYTSGDTISGDVFLSIDRILDNAKAFKVSKFEEYLRVVIHGVLHLCGYKDSTDEERKIMRSKEDFYLNRF